MNSSLHMAFQALLANKLRAALTILGTVIGVTCVVALWHIGISERRYIGDALKAIGGDILYVISRYNADEEDQRRYKHRPLSLADAHAVEESCPSVKGVSPVLWGGARAVFGACFRQTQLRGCFPSYVDICGYTLESGNAFSDSDNRNANPVVILGARVAKDLFGAWDPLGQKIRLDQVPFTVVGVLKAKGSYFGEDHDDCVLLPFSAMADHLGRGRDVHCLFVSTKSRSLNEQAKNEIKIAIRQSQKLPPDRKESIEVVDLGEMTSAVDKIMIGIAMFLGAIGGLSLLVGGIGIMNIMLVSVTERTREIGLRVALGATDFNVLGQFLVEAMVLSGVGGVIGIVCGAGLAWATTAVLTLFTKHPWHFELDFIAIAAAFVFALGIGVFFGFYPAWRASRLDPITALRHE